MRKGCLIYIGIARSESSSYLRKQLEWLHLFLIAATTSNSMAAVQDNPSYDLVHDLEPEVELLHAACARCKRDPAVFLNAFLPTRMHPDSRDMIENVLRWGIPSEQ